MKRMYLKSILCLAIIASLTSCEKVEDTVAKIAVVDINGQGIADVSVRLFGDGSGTTVNVGDIRVDETAVTNAAGDAVFDFTEYYEAGQAGLFVLNIEVEKDSLSAESIIKVEPEIVNEETVILQ
ncbi:MAG: hypothetical protein HKN39_00855 [Flavobacteriales bacterium]|nr:hypothetical protein [Flavobacteriales bacterium]